MYEHFRSLMADAGLSKYIDDILRLTRNSIRIKRKAAPHDDLKIGQSKIGGCPDLPPSLHWPWYNYNKSLLFEPEQRAIPNIIIPTPLAFIAQINLADVSAYDTDGLLPHTGMLYFFYDALNQPGGFGPSDPNGYKVVYCNGIDPECLKRTALPDELAEECRFTALQLKCCREITLPRPESVDLHKLGMSWLEQSAYHDVYWGFPFVPDDADQYEKHRILGYPDIEQDDVFKQAEMDSTGRPIADYETPDVLEAATGWQLLLQVGSVEMDSKTGVVNDMMWGDAGNLYFCIRLSNLEARDFNKVWLVHQCG
jgi:uncharacterized protein YwqG